jgi:translation initiation factor IF-2
MQLTYADVCLTYAEIMELRAPDTGHAEGVVIESRKDKGLGDVAAVIVRTQCTPVFVLLH